MGVIALRGVIDHPELELVDLVVHSDAKSGRDAGELCGIAPVGVVATRTPHRCLGATPALRGMRAAPADGRWRRWRTWCPPCGRERTWCPVRWCFWSSPMP